MDHKEMVYIEGNIEKLITLTVEAGYSLDKFGNIVYKDKNKTIENLKNILEMAANESKLDKEEIRKYLIQIYCEKAKDEENTHENKEILDLLNNIDVKIEDGKKCNEPKEILK